METPEHIVIPSNWLDALCDRLTFESLPPTKPFSLVRNFGWVVLKIPAPYSLCWYIESLHSLREALAFFGLATSVDSSIWSDLVDLPTCLPKDQLKRHGYSTSFMQASEPFRRSLTDGPTTAEVLRVPISLVVKPRQWTPTLLNELAALCKKHHPSNVDSGWVGFDIGDVQLDLQEIQLSEVAVFALLMFLRCELPLSALCVAVDVAGFDQRDVIALVQAIDRPGMVSLKIALRSSIHYDTLLTALARSKHIATVEMDISSLGRLDLGGKPGKITSTTSIQSLKWVSNNQIIPAPLRAIQSLHLSIEQEDWASQLHLVGNRLLALHLYGGRAAPANNIQLNTVFKACPQLRLLELIDISVESLDALTDRYASGSCIIRSLSLQRVEVVQVDSVLRLALLLKDMSSRVAQTLYEFAWVPNVEDVPIEIMDIFVDVVNNNPRLRHLELKSRPTTTTAASLVRHHFQPLLAYDHAFLALVHDAGLGVHTAAIKRLSDDVVGHIFSFAGIHTRRSIYIHNSTWHV